MEQLPRVRTTRPRKRLGRGVGSGKGFHTSSRGQKGQKSRSHVDIMYEGLKMRKSLLNRLPLMRGKGKSSHHKDPLEITLTQLNELPAGTKVTTEKLIEAKMVLADQAYSKGIKILANGEITKKLDIELPISKSASEKVIAAGGTVSNK